MRPHEWRIERAGRAWGPNETRARWQLTPEKFEMSEGGLLDDEQRTTLLGLLLKNVGADAAVRLGDPAVWRAAIARLE